MKQLTFWEGLALVIFLSLAWIAIYKLGTVLGNLIAG